MLFRVTCNPNQLPMKCLHQRKIFSLRIANDNIICCSQKTVQNLTFYGKRLTGTRRSKNQSVWIFQSGTIGTNHISAECIDTIIGCLSILKQFFCSERNKNCNSRSVHFTGNRNVIMTKRQCRNQRLFLSVIIRKNGTVIFLTNTFQHFAL